MDYTERVIKKNGKIYLKLKTEEEYDEDVEIAKTDRNSWKNLEDRD